MGKHGKRSRARYLARRSERRRSKYAYSRGFVDGFVATKEKFVVGGNVLSMTIARPWAAAKNAVRDNSDRTDTGAAEEHCEFLSACAVAASAFELWTGLARPGQIIKLIASAGNATMAARAARTAERLGIDMANRGGSYRVGDVVAELRVPAGGICLRRTSSVCGKLAKRLRRDLPFALCFDLVQWYSPNDASPTSDRRVSYACSSFGVSMPGSEACKPML